MNRNRMLSLAAVLLIILGIIMIILGTQAGIYPPTITGVGFIVIAFTFLGIKTRQ